MRTVGRIATAGATVAGLAAGAWATWSLWPRMAAWGATRHEMTEALPGDDLVPEAKYRTTHAITVDAPPERVWAWLVQIGQGRGGMYSYDWLENLVGLDMHSATDVRPELQDLVVGDTVRLVPEGTEPELVFTVLRVEAPSLLLLGPSGTLEGALDAGLPYPVWTFALSPLGRDRCRLVVRFQCDYRPGVANGLAYHLGLQPVHFLMERKMLLTLKERAERG